MPQALPVLRITISNKWRLRIRADYVLKDKDQVRCIKKQKAPMMLPDMTLQPFKGIYYDGRQMTAAQM
jgi:hypothetical protein